MNSEKLGNAINIYDEIVLLNDLLKAANSQPYLDFHFIVVPGKSQTTYFVVKNEELVCDILNVIKVRKAELEKEFEAL